MKEQRQKHNLSVQAIDDGAKSVGCTRQDSSVQHATSTWEWHRVLDSSRSPPFSYPILLYPSIPPLTPPPVKPKEPRLMHGRRRSLRRKPHAAIVWSVLIMIFWVAGSLLEALQVLKIVDVVQCTESSVSQLSDFVSSLFDHKSIMPWLNTSKMFTAQASTMQPLTPQPENSANQPSQSTKPENPAGSAVHSHGTAGHHVTSASCVCVGAHKCEHLPPSQSPESKTPIHQSSQPTKLINPANQPSQSTKPIDPAGPTVPCVCAAGHHRTSASCVCGGSKL